MTNCNPQAITATGRRSNIDGIECLEYQVIKKAAVERAIWLAPSLSWSIKRDDCKYPVSPNGLIEKMEIRYKAHDILGSIPDFWEAISTDKVGFLKSVRHQVVSCEINSLIEEDMFRLKFEPGLPVFDEDPPGGVEGVVQRDGTLKPHDSRPAYILPGTERNSWHKTVRFYLLLGLAITSFTLVMRKLTRVIEKKRANPVPNFQPPV